MIHENRQTGVYDLCILNIFNKNVHKIIGHFFIICCAFSKWLLILFCLFYSCRLLNTVTYPVQFRHCHSSFEVALSLLRIQHHLANHGKPKRDTEQYFIQNFNECQDQKQGNGIRLCLISLLAYKRRCLDTSFQPCSIQYSEVMLPLMCHPIRPLDNMAISRLSPKCLAVCLYVPQKSFMKLKEF